MGAEAEDKKKVAADEAAAKKQAAADKAKKKIAQDEADAVKAKAAEKAAKVKKIKDDAAAKDNQDNANKDVVMEAAVTSEGVMLPALVGFAAGASVVGLGAAVMRRKVAALEEPLVA